MDSKLKKIARVGYVAKATVYGIMGILTFLAAFNMGGQKSSNLQVIEFLQKQAFGNALLVLIGLGLLCYSAWRFIQSIQDPENIGDDKKGKGKRVAYFISAVLYLGLAVYAFMKLINAGSSSGGGSGGGLTGTLGVVVFSIIGVGLVVASIAQFNKAKTKKFLDDFGYNSITDEKKRKTVKNTGYLGLIARGIIFGVLAYIFIRAAVESNTSDMKGTADAFSFLQDSPYGSWLMGLVAAGLVCYSIYVFMLAKYRKFKA
ncbi:hypothetical protein APR41_09780 [Salegentibacter salinarum]|uniref:DUF1206 domain-containing protein n=1 Tax=Salegentibacter salinarum TaxID=447422 RepID=A0A2N0TMW8_9FLAO|nr:DUF1206 domain-containing protein [Salegentibacter salinarum]PKD16074.1 hypothetical protein APR41_09780 [Salegentibacter salinarum]SKB69737.1 protein of unknown function [Salegentibacter salinarum]